MTDADGADFALAVATDRSGFAMVLVYVFVGVISDMTMLMIFCEDGILYWYLLVSFINYYLDCAWDPARDGGFLL